MRLARTSPEAQEAMVTLLASDDPKVLIHAGWAMYRGPDRVDDEIRSIMVDLLDHPEREVWLAAARTLAEVDPDNESLLSVLLEKLQSPISIERYNAAWVLADLGPRADPAKDLLFQAMIEDIGPLQRNAPYILAKIGLVEDDVRRLLGMLLHDSAAVREASVVALSSNPNPDRSMLIATLIRCLDDDSEKVRLAAATRLRPHGIEAAEALTKLDAMTTDDPDPWTRSAAMKTADLVRKAQREAETDGE